MWTQGTTVSSLFPIPSDHYEVPELENHLDAGSNLAFPDILSRNVTVEEDQMHQLTHKRIPRDIEFFDEHGTPVTYQIQHEDNPSDTCNDFYPIKYKRGTEEKILRLQNDGEDFTVSSMLDEFPII